MHARRLFLVAATAATLALTLAGQDLTTTEPGWLDPVDPPDTLPGVRLSLDRDALPEGLRRAESPAFVEYYVFLHADGTVGAYHPFATHPLLEHIQPGSLLDVRSPARRGGRAVPSEIRFQVVFNPRSARTGEPDATPRLLAARLATWRKDAEQGGDRPRTVLVQATVDITGAVTAVTLPEGLPPFLEGPVNRAVRAYRFAPARRNGAAVEATVEVPVLCVAKTEGGPTGERVPPRVLTRRDPVYPSSMQQGGFEGRVTLDLEINLEGRVRTAHVVESTHPAFDDAALDAAMAWTFDPARVGDRPVHARLLLAIQFSIRGGGITPWRIARPRSFPPELPEAFHWDAAPELLAFAPPVFPRDAQLANRSGDVTVVFAIGPQGSVLQARPDGDADPILAAAAVAAVEAFQFKPATREGRPSAALLRMKFDFNRRGMGDAPVTATDRALLRRLRESPGDFVPLSALDALPVAVSQKPPQTPVGLAAEGGTAEALVEFIIDRRGIARLPHALEATSPAVGAAAVQAVASWRFEPPLKDGIPVDAVATIPVVFRVRGSGAGG